MYCWIFLVINILLSYIYFIDFYLIKIVIMVMFKVYINVFLKWLEKK